MKGKSDLTLVIQPEAYFHELITAACKTQKVQVKPETEFYLVNLLGQFISAENLAIEEPLALLLKQALDAPHPEVQKALFRQVGDVSLYVAGFFQESLFRKLVDVDYYCEMGGKAYQQVASLAPEDHLRKMFGELAQRFSSCVEVLAEVSEKTAQKDEKNLLRLYELWLRTGSERAAKSLQEAGIMPNETISKKLQ